MARIRSIKPTFWTDEKVGILPRAVRLTFLGLISALADDHGRLVGNARIIRGAVYPYDEDVTVAEVSTHVEALIAANRVLRYTVNGDDYLFIRHWFQHQRVDKPQKSLLPAPPVDPDGSHTPHEPVVEPSSNGRRSFQPERSGAERNGLEMERSGAEERDDSSALSPLSARADDLDPQIRPDDRAAPPAPLVELPVEAERFLEQLYSLASEKRRLDVRRQLYETLSPLSRGARLRRGVMVKARSSEHLAYCCRAVIEDPPRNVDAAVVILLEKLQDPPPGPTPSETHAASESARIADEESYQRAARSAGVTWAKANPDAYAPIATALDAEFPNAAANTFMRMARDSALVQRCAKAAGFPEFDVWRHEHARHGQHLVAS